MKSGAGLDYTPVSKLEISIETKKNGVLNSIEWIMQSIDITHSSITIVEMQNCTNQRSIWHCCLWGDDYGQKCDAMSNPL